MVSEGRRDYRAPGRTDTAVCWVSQVPIYPTGAPLLTEVSPGRRPKARRLSERRAGVTLIAGARTEGFLHDLPLHTKGLGKEPVMQRFSQFADLPKALGRDRNRERHQPVEPILKLAAV